MASNRCPASRFPLINSIRQFRNPLFWIPWVSFPIAGAILTWFGGNLNHRDAGYWVIAIGFQGVWTWSTWNFLTGSVDPGRNYVELRDDGLRIRLHWLADKWVPYSSIESAAVREPGYNLFDVLASGGRLPRGQHVRIRFRKRLWRPFPAYHPSPDLGRSAVLKVDKPEVFLADLNRRVCDASVGNNG